MMTKFLKAFFILFVLSAAPVSAQSDRAMLAAALQPLADAGNGEALYHLGMMRHLGIGGEKDEAAAFELFKRSAEAGDPLGNYEFGDYYARAENGIVAVDPALALKYKLIAAEAGYALAQHDVAKLYFDTDATDSALEWLTRSGQQGHADALRALASLYNSDAIPKDAARTFAYYSLYLTRIAAPTEKQTAWLTGFVSGMSEDDQVRGKRILNDWTITVTPLTSKALSGLRAAAALVSAPPKAKTTIKPKPKRRSKPL
jgi:uncharacterized protein